MKCVNIVQLILVIWKSSLKSFTIIDSSSLSKFPTFVFYTAYSSYQLTNCSNCIWCIFLLLFLFSTFSLTKFVKSNDYNDIVIVTRSYPMTLYFGPKLCRLFCCKDNVKMALSVAQRKLDPRSVSLDIRQRIFP